MANKLNGLPWTHDELIMLNNLKKTGKSNREIADVLNASLKLRDYTANLVRKKYRDTNWDSILGDITNKLKLAEEQEEVHADKDRILESTLANQERLIRRDSTRTEIIIENIKSAIYRLPKPKPTSLMYTANHDVHYNPEHVGVIVSDVHVGAKYTLEETGGLSEYNLDIFKRRLNRLKTSVLEITERHRLMYEIPHLHVFCLGDLVAGMNDAGEWSSSYIDLDIYDQMFEGIAGLRDIMATWSRNFPKVTFYGIFGNHGRVGRRGVNKVSTNWDRIAYTFLQQSLQEYSNIDWVIPTSWFIQQKILGHNFYLTHGDGIKGSMGIPYYGVERTERNINGLMKEKPDYLMIGHFHSCAELVTNSSRIMMNGSFMGGDMYSLKDLNRSSRPEQKMFGIHAKKGVTWTYNIHLDEEG